MATRATRVAPAHVEALNRIDLEFRPDRYWFFQPKRKLEEKSLVEAWRQYAQQLDTTFDENAEAERESHGTQRHVTFFMNCSIKCRVYLDSNLRSQTYRKMLIIQRLMAGARICRQKYWSVQQSFCKVINLLKWQLQFPVSDSADQRQIELSDLMKNVLSEGSVKVNLTSAPKSKSKTSRR